jgi:predicted PurR-regulated permease PerM
VLVLIAFVVINEIGSKVLYPRLVGAALGLHEVLVLFVLFAGLEVGGIVGVLFAAPVTAFAIVTMVHLYRYWHELPDDLLSGTVKKPAKPVAKAKQSSAPVDDADTSAATNV